MPVSRADVIIVNKDFEPRNAEEVFLKQKFIIIDALKQNLVAHDKDQPGKLIQSINVEIDNVDGKLVFTLEMEDYWKFVDEGVSGWGSPNGSQYKFKNDGKPANIGAMLEFIKVRGIKGTPKKVQKGLKSKRIKKALKQINRDKVLKQIAFAIGKSIKKKGIKPTYFFSDVINEELYLQLKEDLTKALGRDIELSFQV